MGDPTVIDLVRELRTELGLFDGAMPVSPKKAWAEALDHVRRLRSQVDEAQLRSIEARNPGIDIDEVRRLRKRQS